jgi:DNA mismatch repair ATPase MutS
MLAVYIQGTKCGVVCIDIENNHFYIEQFDEKKEGGSNIHHIRRILNKYRPVEIIVQRKDNSTKKIAKQICQPYIIEMEPMEGSLLHIIKTMNELSGDSFFQRLISLYYE